MSIPWPSTNAAGPVVAEPAQSLFLLVHGGHVPALSVELESDVRADAAAADDQAPSYRSH